MLALVRQMNMGTSPTLPHVLEKAPSPSAASPDQHHRPMLASEVRLVGEMPDVGFQERQWLIERGGHFIQVTELLYRVLERIDGVRTVVDIAREVTEATEWALEPDHINHLIESKLRPLGLLIHPNGTTPHHHSSAIENSPLRLAMRLRMLPPIVVDPLSNALRYLYTPPALLAMSLMIVVAHWWLYTTHAVTSGLEAAFYAPGGLLVVLGLAIAAGLFHELGHAAALRYGGGHSRGIGFGLYLVFPAFFSDVTDSYRLPRRARVRTDLGGIYFHLIFATILIALAALFETQFLLAAVLVFNIEAFRQLMPFVRLDGYWLLADLTGVPDFLSQMKAFVRSVAPGQPGSGDILPALKPWVRCVFALYIVTAIPALVWFLALTIWYVPDLVGLTRQALEAQVQLVSAAYGSGTRVLAAIQMMLIPLPLVATGYFLFRLLMIGLRQFAWGKLPRPIPRLATATGLAVVAVGLAVFLIRPVIVQRAPQPLSDAARALDLLHSVEQSTLRVNSLHARLRGVINGEPFVGSVILRRPNLARVEVEGSASVGKFTVVSDGSNVYVYFPADNRFTKADAAHDGRNIDAFIVDHVRGFFRPSMMLPRSGETASYVGRQADDEYDVVEVESRARHPVTVRYHISADDGLVHRIDATTWRNNTPSTRSVELLNLRLNDGTDTASFRWAPPAGAEPLTLATLGIGLP